MQLESCNDTHRRSQADVVGAPRDIDGVTGTRIVQGRLNTAEMKIGTAAGRTNRHRKQKHGKAVVNRHKNIQTRRNTERSTRRDKAGTQGGEYPASNQRTTVVYTEIQTSTMMHEEHSSPPGKMERPSQACGHEKWQTRTQNQEKKLGNIRTIGRITYFIQLPRL